MCENVWIWVENEAGRRFDWPIQDANNFHLPAGLTPVEGYPPNFSGQPRPAKNKIELERDAVCDSVFDVEE